MTTGELPSTTDRAATPPVRPGWPDLDDAALMDVRFCELGLTIEGSWIEGVLARFWEELAARGSLDA